MDAIPQLSATGADRRFWAIDDQRHLDQRVAGAVVAVHDGTRVRRVVVRYGDRCASGRLDRDTARRSGRRRGTNIRPAGVLVAGLLPRRAAAFGIFATA